MLAVNHEEAYILAQVKQENSNLARCYLAVIADLRNLGDYSWSDLDKDALTLVTRLINTAKAARG